MKVAFRALLAVTLLAGVYALAAGLALLMFWFGVWYMHLAPGAGVDRATSISFLVLSIAAALALLLGPFARAPRASRSEPGTVLTCDRHPNPWSGVRSLAELVGTRPPDEVRLVPTSPRPSVTTPRCSACAGASARCTSVPHS